MSLLLLLNQPAPVTPPAETGDGGGWAAVYRRLEMERQALELKAARNAAIRRDDNELVTLL